MIACVWDTFFFPQHTILLCNNPVSRRRQSIVGISVPSSLGRWMSQGPEGKNTSNPVWIEARIQDDWSEKGELALNRAALGIGSRELNLKAGTMGQCADRGFWTQVALSFCLAFTTYGWWKPKFCAISDVSFFTFQRRSYLLISHTARVSHNMLSEFSLRWSVVRPRY